MTNTNDNKDQTMTKTTKRHLIETAIIRGIIRGIWIAAVLAIIF